MLYVKLKETRETNVTVENLETSLGQLQLRNANFLTRWSYKKYHDLAVTPGKSGFVGMRCNLGIGIFVQQSLGTTDLRH